ncbi:MAG: glycosyltransferase family 4 protein [Bryobacteraceae bacterium]
MTADRPLRLAYLVSRYPAVSHTFILREVLALQQTGFAIEAASINLPDRPTEGLTSEERAEAARTFYIKNAGWLAVVRAHLAALAMRPARYVAGLVYAVSLGGADLKKILYCLFYFIEAVLIGDWMRRRRLSHLHVHFATPASTAGLIASKIYPMTLSITVHGPDEFYDAPGYRLLEKIEGSSFLCVIGRYARSQLMKLSPASQWSKFEVSPLGVDPEQFAPAPFREAPGTFEVICVGRLTPAKGQQVLIAAIAKLVAEGRDVRLRLVGDGPDRAALEQDARARGLAGKVIFEGAVNQDRIRAFYQGADAFALASFAEGIPVVLMEAMAMEIPCVTTFITGIPELIRPGVDGLLVAPSDDDELASAIGTLMDDASLRRRLGQAGRRRVIEKYDLQTNTARLGAIFRRRLGASQ